MPNGIYQEREALLDRIRFFESSATYFKEDRRPRVPEFTDRHVAYAKARLEQINRRIAGFEDSATA
jgi:hypothetical protein